MTKNEAQLLAKFMDELGDRFGNDGCNDYELPAAPENRELIIEAEKWGGGGEWSEPHEYSPVPSLGKFYITSNFIILGYLRHKFMEENGLTE